MLTEIRWSILSMDELTGIVLSSRILDESQLFALLVQCRNLNAPPRNAPCNAISAH